MESRCRSCPTKQDYTHPSGDDVTAPSCFDKAVKKHFSGRLDLLVAACEQQDWQIRAKYQQQVDNEKKKRREAQKREEEAEMAAAAAKDEAVRALDAHEQSSPYRLLYARFVKDALTKNRRSQGTLMDDQQPADQGQSP